MTFKTQMYFTDDVPKFYCGMRGVEIKIGRKWVRILEPATGRKARIRMSHWERIKHRAKVTK